MQYIVVMTARHVNLQTDDWVVNAIGRKGTAVVNALDFCIFFSFSVSQDPTLDI